MEMIKVDTQQLHSEKTIEKVVQKLRNGEVIVYPTDTIYGLGCLSTLDHSVRRIYKIKQRERTKPLLVLVSDMQMVSDFFYIEADQEEILNKYWPGPYTFLLKERGYCSALLQGKRGDTGVRLPKNNFIIRIVDRVEEPIVSTSLNLSGKDILDSPENIESEFGNDLPDMVIDAGGIEEGTPSTLIDLTDPENIKTLRR